LTDNKIRITYIVAASAFVLSMISVGALLVGDDSVNELSASLSNRLNSHESHIEELNEKISKEANFNKMDATHLLALQATVDKLEEQNTQQQIDIAILNARGDVTTQPTGTTPPVDTIQLQLRHSDNKGNTKPSGYPRDVPAVLIQGESSFQKKSFIITIKDPNGAFVKDKFGVTLSDGDISEAWIPSTNPVAGTYTVTIKIDLKTDSIQFNLL